VKVHVGGDVSHTGQLFFPEALSTKVYKTSPYTQDTNTRTYRANDRVYTGQHGSSSILKITDGTIAGGLRGTIALAVES
jgi:hypothetical protein